MDVRNLKGPAAAIAVLVAGISVLPLMGGRLQATPSAEAFKRLPPPAVARVVPASAQLETAVLAGGCFWGVQGVFSHVKGVRQAVSGYAGGPAAAANYELVSTGVTGHAEAVQVTFDPREISYGEVLRIFFSIATDPTQLNRQFPDEGPQYRSEIFYSTPAQAALAKAYIAQLGRAKAFNAPIVTKIEALKAFYPAEGYHQDYLTLHPEQDYIAQFDLPKVTALKALFPERYLDQPILSGSRRS